ncbi:MAG TPA: hypothetical protein ENI06_04315 [Spirochaetales bacterium]|nr:hypothetical protein [Spirochaetales bacterium]
MAVLKLRNHIPIGGPARREPVNGSESAMRVSLGFEPGWFYRRCGVDFSEKWHKDPYYRYETLKNMKQVLVRAFPSVTYWDLSCSHDLATISGCYGAYPIPHAFGIPLVYAPDRWPALVPDKKLSITEIEKLDAEKILSGPVVEELFSQMDTIEKEWGKIHGYLNWQGILNNGFNLRGQEIFLDIYDKPDFVHHFFSIIYEVMVSLAQMVQERQRRSGFDINQMSVSNCVMNMISPELYEEFIFPYDSKIAYQFERFGVHTCNWNVTPYIEVLSRLPKLGYLDMGIMSDLPRVKETFNNTYRAVLYSPVTLQEAGLKEIRRDMEKIYRELAPCDVVMADIQATTPDERVNEFIEISRNLESKEEK